MNESYQIVLHMDRLIAHVSGRLKTTPVWDFLYDRYKVIPTGETQDVREAIIKVRKLLHRYYQLWERKDGRLRTQNLPNAPVILLYDWDKHELNWMKSLWLRGKWNLVILQSNGIYREPIRDGGKVIWRRCSGKTVAAEVKTL